MTTPSPEATREPSPEALAAAMSFCNRHELSWTEDQWYREAGHIDAEFAALRERVERLERENAELVKVGESMAQWIEMLPATRAYKAGLGVGEWEAFLRQDETIILKVAKAAGLGTWAQDERYRAAAALSPSKEPTT